MASISCNSGAYTIIGAASVLAFSLAVAPGSYATTGTAASLVHGYPITAAVGHYTLTGSLVSIARVSAEPGGYLVGGQPATLTVNSANKTVSATAGSYAYTGTVARLVLSKQYNVGLYALTGTAATLSQTGDPVVNAFSGSYTITGGNTVLEHIRLIGTGDYQITGTAATLKKGKGLVGNAGTYLIAGTAAKVAQSRHFPSAEGTYGITGAIATLRYSNEPAKVLVLNSGIYTLTGQAAALPITLNAAVGSYALTGQYAQLLPRAESGTYAITGTPVTFVRTSNILDPAIGSYQITGTAATLRGPGPHLAADSGNYVYFGFDPSILSIRFVSAAPGVYLATGTDAYIRVTHIIAEPGQYVITPTIPSDHILQTTRPRRWRKQSKQPVAMITQPTTTETWEAQPGSPGV